MPCFCAFLGIFTLADNDLSSLDNRFEKLWLGLVFVDISSPHALDSMQPEAGAGIKVFVLDFVFKDDPFISIYYTRFSETVASPHNFSRSLIPYKPLRVLAGL